MDHRRELCLWQLERDRGLGREGTRLRCKVDLPAQEIIAPDGSVTHFEINGFRKAGLLAGQDELELVLAKADAIRDYETRDRNLRPWVYGA